MTFPEPTPDNETVSALFCPKLAVTDEVAVIVTAHVAVPLHAPPQPEKLYPEAGVAVSVTCVSAQTMLCMSKDN